MSNVIDIWDPLISLRELEADSSIMSWSYGENGFSSHHEIPNQLSSSFHALLVKEKSTTRLHFDSCSCIDIPIGDFNLFYKQSIKQDILHELVHYWPLAVLHNVHLEKPFVMTHVASSLDGRIATMNGHSKWIGNPENLNHAHKLRALTESILVGANTVKNDSPKLNVRNVKGNSPIRFVLSNESEDLTGLDSTCNVKSYLLRDSTFQNKQIKHNFDDIFYFDSFKNILDCLADKNIKSLLIEGGSKTISSFLKHDLIDVLQIHYAPIILGSGKHISDLPEIKTIAESRQFKQTMWTPVGNSYMITAKI